MSIRRCRIGCFTSRRRVLTPAHCGTAIISARTVVAGIIQWCPTAAGFIRICTLWTTRLAVARNSPCRRQIIFSERL
jgi:hypothetical protein